MAAAGADRSTPTRHPEGGRRLVSYPVATGVTIYAGTLVALVAGYAKPAADVAGAIVVGIAQQQVINAGADGAVSVSVAADGSWKLANSAIVAADLGKVAYVVDDSTVSDASGTNAIAVGTIEEIESDGVWVHSPLESLLTNAQAAIAGSLGVKQHAIVAGDITATHYDFTFPFTVAAFSVTYRSAAGVPLATTDGAAINAGNVRISLAGTGAPALIATDVVAVVASA